MKKSLAHLPEPKRDELQRVTEIILDECSTVLMIILFGSHARGDWVEDRHFEDGTLHEYLSDFDILVIVRSNKIVNSTDTWRRAETRARRFPNRTWTNLIVESIETVNNARGKTGSTLKGKTGSTLKIQVSDGGKRGQPLGKTGRETGVGKPGSTLKIQVSEAGKRGQPLMGKRLKIQVSDCSATAPLRTSGRRRTYGILAVGRRSVFPGAGPPRCRSRIGVCARRRTRSSPLWPSSKRIHVNFYLKG